MGAARATGAAPPSYFVTLLSDGEVHRLQKVSLPPGEYPSRFSKRDLRLGSRVEVPRPTPRELPAMRPEMHLRGLYAVI